MIGLTTVVIGEIKVEIETPVGFEAPVDRPSAVA
jgi:hypothetical protein